MTPGTSDGLGDGVDRVASESERGIPTACILYLFGAIEIIACGL